LGHIQDNLIPGETILYQAGYHWIDANEPGVYNLCKRGKKWELYYTANGASEAKLITDDRLREAELALLEWHKANCQDCVELAPERWDLCAEAQELLVREDLLSAHVSPTYTTVVDQDRKFVEVSESFSKLVGYKVEELIGTRYDDLTALNTADIPMTYNLFSRLGHMHGLWMLVHRTGYQILIRYESRLRPDTNIQSNIEVLQTIV
jgi:PAS domain S-box-containing protein